MNIIKEHYGKTLGGKDVAIFTLENGKGLKAKITNYGATIVSIVVPDKNGDFKDVVLGFDKLEDYFENTPYFGSIIGRHANRIEKGSFELNGRMYKLAINNGDNHLHGGIIGFNKVLWDAEIVYKADGIGLQLTYLSEDGEEGYPGNLHVMVTYTLQEDNYLTIEYTAQSDQDTVVNLTNHTYFNLKGQMSGDILNHQLMILADKYTVIDDQGVPTGEIQDLDGTDLDFRTLTRIGDRINSKEKQIVNGIGYDHNWVLNVSGDRPEKVAQVVEPESGRILEVYTTKPGIQFYTGNFLDGTVIGKGNVAYEKRSGLCLETQYFPNAMKHLHFPSPILRKGEQYKHTTMYKFTTIQ